MTIVGLTGSIGMGKSTVAKMFADEGVPVFDADAVVHRLQGPEGALVAGIEAHFPGTTGQEGVDRTALAEAVLGEPEALLRLEALIHPAVAREREAFLAEHVRAPLVLLDIPLLFEKGGWDKVDAIVVVAVVRGVLPCALRGRHRRASASVSLRVGCSVETCRHRHDAYRDDRGPCRPGGQWRSMRSA